MAYPDQEQEDNPEAGGEKLQSAAGTTLSGYSSPTGTAQDKQSGMHTNLQSYIDQNRSQTSDMATKAFMKPERQNILSGIATNMSGLEGSNEGLTQSQINQRLSPYESRIKEYETSLSGNNESARRAALNRIQGNRITAGGSNLNQMLLKNDPTARRLREEESAYGGQPRQKFNAYKAALNKYLYTPGIGGGVTPMPTVGPAYVPDVGEVEEEVNKYKGMIL